LNGELVRETSITVNIPTIVLEVEERKLDDGSYRFIKGKVVGTGEDVESAVKSFKKAYKEA